MVGSPMHAWTLLVSTIDVRQHRVAYSLVKVQSLKALNVVSDHTSWIIIIRCHRQALRHWAYFLLVL